jgi:ABC-2 type transport system permease protein
MWKDILYFEIQQGFKKVSVWVYFIIFFALAFLIANILGGAFTGASIVIGNQGTNVNSPLLIAELQTVFTIFGVLICAAIFGNAGYRDYETNMHPLIFTTPIKPASYYSGRFLGSFLLTIFIQLGITLGLAIGFLMPYLDQDAIGIFRLDAYLHPIFVMVIPNVFLVGAILFSLAILSRRMLPTYLASVILLFGYLTSSNLTSDIETRWIASLLDPFGGEAISDLVKYWTPSERDTLLIPLGKWLVFNRIIWFFVGAFFFLFGMKKFSFSKEYKLFNLKRDKSSQAAEEELFESSEVQKIIRPVFNRFTTWLQFTTQLKIEIKRAFRDPYFLAIAGTAAGFLLLNQSAIGKMYGVNTLPVTYEVLSVLSGSFALFMIIIITFYSGQIIWKERELKADQIIDSLPVANWIPMVSKLVALIILPGIMLSVLMIVGIGIQTWKGFYDFEVALYFKKLFILDWTRYMLLCVLAFSIQIMVNHKYLGHFLMILYFLFGIFAGQLGLNHTLYYFGSGSGAPYSDMNGYTPYLERLITYKLYWISFSALIIILSNLFWVRGSYGDFKSRLEIAKNRINKFSIIGISVSLILFIGFGSYIFYNTNILNEYHQPKYYEKLAAEYEKKYKKYKDSKFPKITSISGEVHLFPKESRLEFSGSYILKNKTENSIDTIHSNFNARFPYEQYSWSADNKLIVRDSIYGWDTYVFDPPILPGDEITLNFSGNRGRKGFTNSGVDMTVLDNGTMIFSSQLFPTFGYSSDRELSQKRTRKKYGLKEDKDPMRPYNDAEGLQYGILGDDADWVDYEMIVSTDVDQIAMTPGYLIKEYEENNRKFFHYKMDKPIHNLFAFVSGRYQVMQEVWNGIKLEIFYHPKHSYNLATMMNGMKKSIEYYSELYGPYPYKQCRIIEFPRYSSFAVSFPNTIPFSESIGFVMDVDPNDPEDLDMPFWVTAHEMGHQWWPHQTAGGNVQGSAFLSEGLSEYSAVSLLAKEKGEKQLRKFLKYELDKYLMGRAMESRHEPSIMKTEGQQYIHYNKAGLMMYTLSDFIGKDKFNKALKAFMDMYRYKSSPYADIGTFVKMIKDETPEDLQYLIDDTFSKITLYENKAKSATAKQNDDGTYEVTFTVEAKKVFSDSLGNQTNATLNDWLEVGILCESDLNGEKIETPILIEKVFITDSLTTFTYNIDQKPIKAGIDPMNKFVDRIVDDNLIKVEF